MFKKIFKIFTLFFLMLINSDVFGQGCSQCKLVAKQGSELSEDSFGTNINWGIMYLMLIPYLILMLFFRKQIMAFLRKIFKKKQ